MSQAFEVNLDLPEYSTKFPLTIGGVRYTATGPSVEQVFETQSRLANLRDDDAGGKDMADILKTFWTQLQLPPEGFAAAQEIRFGAQIATLRKVFDFLSASI